LLIRSIPEPDPDRHWAEGADEEEEEEEGAAEEERDLTMQAASQSKDGENA
jgi:hypothetical protein